MPQTIVIMAKLPVAGRVKTRLRPVLSDAECAGLADAFLRDALEKCAAVAEKTILAYDAPDDSDIAAGEYLSGGAVGVRQTDGDLGARMAAAFEFAFRHSDGAPVLTIGTDSPTLPPSILESAFEHLQNGADAVFGPARDGGFYLLGLRRPAHGLFGGIEWSTPSVGAAMRANLRRHHFTDLRVLPEFYDVDTPAELRELIEELQTQPTPAAIAAHTCRRLGV